MSSVHVINAPNLSSEAPDETIYAWTLSNKNAMMVIDNAMLLIEVLGFVGVVFVFLVARYLVRVEKKTGQ